MKLTKCVLVLSVGFALGAATAPACSADPLVIGFSQAASNSAHRNTMTKRNQSYATENYKDAKLIVTNAEGKSAKQISDIESLQVQGMKVLMISAQDSAAITPTMATNAAINSTIMPIKAATFCAGQFNSNNTLPTAATAAALLRWVSGLSQKEILG